MLRHDGFKYICFTGFQVVDSIQQGQRVKDGKPSSFLMMRDNFSGNRLFVGLWE